MAAWHGSRSMRCLQGAPPLPGPSRGLLCCGLCVRPRVREENGPSSALAGPVETPLSGAGPGGLRVMIWGPEVGAPAVRLEPLPPLPPSERECEEFDAVW